VFDRYGDQNPPVDRGWATVVGVRNAVIVLNGASSSGKSSIAVELQGLLPRPFLAFGVDTLVASLPPASSTHEPGIVFGSDGVVAVDDRFRLLEHAWYRGLGAIARDGVGVIIDEVFLGGRESQDRLRSALGGLRVVWVGVRCDLEVAVAREVARPERTQGMASSQAIIVHGGIQYDLQVDTTTNTALECATTIADYIADR
jgi:chloramphenicol 3-O phosphotransferase